MSAPPPVDTAAHPGSGTTTGAAAGAGLEPAPGRPPLSPRLAAYLREYRALARMPYPKTPEGQEDEEAFGARCDRMHALLIFIASLPGKAPLDPVLKLTLACQQMREHVDLADRLTAAPYLLAESARDDLILHTLTP